MFVASLSNVSKFRFKRYVYFAFIEIVEISYRRVLAPSIPNAAYFHGCKEPSSPVYQTISSSAVPTIVLDLLYDSYM